MKIQGKAAANSRMRQQSYGLLLYFLLLSVHAAAVVLLLSNMIPVYRVMVLDFSKFTPDMKPWWAIAGLLLAQIAYWLRVWLQPPLPRNGSIVLGHVVQFFARMGFVCATAGFSVMFLTHYADLKDINYQPLRVLIMLMIFFALFCWTLELERLGKALVGNQA